MYRIRMPDGTEASYATVEEFSTAVVEGRVPDTAAIYHQRAEKWLAIAAHPHFKAALERGPARPAAAASHAPMMASGKRPARRIPTGPAQAAPSQNGNTAPRVAAVAPKPAPQPHTETSHRTVAPSAMVMRLQALTAEATARTNGAAAAPTAPEPTPVAPVVQAAPVAPSDPTEALELLPENELPPVAPPAAVKLPTVHSKPKLPAIRPAEPVAETSPLGGLNPLEPEAPRSELASPEIESLVPAPAPENLLLTSRSTHLEGLPLVEIPDTAGPLPYVTDHAPAAPRHSAPRPVAVAPPVPAAAPIPAVAPVAEIEAPVFEQPHYTAPKSRRGLLVAAGIAAVLVIAVSAVLLRPSASEAANAESVQVSTSAAQQAALPVQQPVTTVPVPQPSTPASTEPTIAKGARVEPALRQERASRNRVDPTPAEAASAGEDGVVPAARLPVPTSIDASIKVGAEQSGQPSLIDRDKALEATRKAIVDKDR